MPVLSRSLGASRSGFGARDDPAAYCSVGAPAPTQPSAFHGRAGDTPVRALGERGLRAQRRRTATTSAPRWRVGPFWPHSARLTLQHGALALTLRGFPVSPPAPPLGWLFTGSPDPRGLAPGADAGRLESSRPPRRLSPARSQSWGRCTSELVSQEGARSEAAFGVDQPPPESSGRSSTEWAVTDGTGGTEDGRRHPTAHASSL